MNLYDYERMVNIFLGECAGCGDCKTCSIVGVIGQVWESGRRSGASSAAVKHSQKCLIDEWDFNKDKESIEEYVLKTSDDLSRGGFVARAQAWHFFEQNLERMKLWAGSRAKPVYSMNWTMFAKNWLRNQLKEMPEQRAQEGLFDQKHTARPSRQQQAYLDTRSAVLSMNSKSGSPSASGTSQPTGKEKTRSELMSSSTTPNRSH